MLSFPHKEIRARVIADYCKRAGISGVVCFSCGNASRALFPFIDTVDISPCGDLRAERWWRPDEIRRVWPDRLDATPGHLPIHLMEEIGDAYAEDPHFPLFSCGPEIFVPTGSGELLVCLALRWPSIRFVAVYNQGPATEYHEEAPLNGLVRRLAHRIEGLENANA